MESYFTIIGPQSGEGLGPQSGEERGKKGERM